MKVLIAVLTCHKFRPRADALRATWATAVRDADLRFFLGEGGGPLCFRDEIILNVDDSYKGLPAKIKAACQWALQAGYDFMYKSDDDAYVVPERLLRSGFQQFDYVGRVRGPSGIFPAPYCSGFGYWLSRKAMQVIADAPLNGDDAEDRFVANTLLTAGIRPHHDPRYAVATSNKHSPSAHEAPRVGNNLIAACEFPPERMPRIHREWLLRVPSRMPAHAGAQGTLSRVCVLIKTFLRDGCLFRCLDGLERNFPEVKLVLVDDGWESQKKIQLYAELRERGHVCNWLPFDSGFGAKANEGIVYCDRPFVLVASDDFDFSHPQVRPGIEKLQTVLERDGHMHIASGRVNGRAYESTLQVSDHSVREICEFRETRTVDSITYRVCDLTINYSLIRRECFGPEKLHWDGDVKIGGGEHGAFFLDAKRLGYGVCMVEGVDIREMSWNYSQVHPAYPQYRGRAAKPGRICLKRRGVDHWYLQDGSAETT